MNYRKNNPKIRAVSLKHDNRILNYLKMYSSQKKRTLTFNSINMDFYYDFYKYLSSGEKPLRDSSIGAIVKQIKAFMVWSLKNEYHQNFKFREIPIDREENPPVTLSINELEILENIKLENARLEKIRNLFLLQTYLCIRVEDLMSINPQNINMEKGLIIGLKANKTNHILPDVSIRPVCFSCKVFDDT